MDQTIYDYLIFNKNENQSITTEIDLFLDCLLILSINKININYNNLLQYCNNNERDNSSSNLYFGLNNDQFNILYKIIKSIIVINNKENNQLIYNHTLNNNNNNNNDDDDQISKFDCSIIIIIKNNLKLQQQQQQQPQNQQQQQNHIIKNNKQKNKNYLLFKKVWNNIVIRNEILFHLRLFNFHLQNISLNFLKLKEYKYRNYINDLNLSSQHGLNIDTFTTNYSKYISSSIEKLEINGFDKFEDNSIPNTIKILILCGRLNQKITKKKFKDYNYDNIIELEFGNYFNQSFSTNDDDDGGDGNGDSWLPRNLKSLKLGSSFQQTIHPGQLPNSLTSLILHKRYNGIIKQNSIPKSVTTLDYTFISNKNLNKIKENPIDKSVTNLTFDNYFNQIIEIGDIPHNVTSLKFGINFNNTIKSNSLPLSLQSLELNGMYNQPQISGVYPPNLTSLIFGNMFSSPISFESDENGIIQKQQLYIPSSITKLHFGWYFNSPITIETFKHLTNLKDLRIGGSYQIDIGTLPNSITSLNLYCYRGILYPGTLPKSLTSLSYSNPFYSIVILPNVLPDSVTKLNVHDSTSIQPFKPNSLPSNLKSIYIGKGYKHDLSLVDWPISLENIHLSTDNEIINILPVDFFIKYIKPFINKK